MSDVDPTALGFALVGQRRDGTRQYSLQLHPYLVYWLVARPDGTAELHYEFALGEYLKAKGFSISGQDELSLLLFPEQEATGPMDLDWISSEVERTQERLGAMNLAEGT